ncbi:hypothetical protein BT96DRAFT_941130 [Gymnopus androsaceus JB14]|uniref:Uncharacterized protein n=1 Tax=Gymnopus androsaceus JB14 TaxID=1447944 RepID=A0A6A4HFB0_9AGAR|nr:hypothetical protein BT96DRAFT_941130 [Gymnopus androsaceus JB14]
MKTPFTTGSQLLDPSNSFSPEGTPVPSTSPVGSPNRTPSPRRQSCSPSPRRQPPSPSPRVSPDIRPSPRSTYQSIPIPNNPPPLMAAIQPLPARNEQSAPKWDSKFEEQLPTFFEEFETVAAAAGIANSDVDMKKGILCYADPESMRFWRTLPMFKDVAKTWTEFKKEVLSHYPGAEEVAEATMEDLKKVVSEFAKSGISNRAWYPIRVQVASFYVQAFPDSIRIRLDTHLQVSFPKKTKGQVYSLTKLRKAIDFLLSDASTTVIGGNFSVGDHSVAPISSITVVVIPKAKPTESKLDQLTQTVSSLAQLMVQMASKGDGNSSRGNHPPKPNRLNRCFWDDCDSPKFDDCVDLCEWVTQGRVERDANGFVQLRGGQCLPRNQRYTKGTLKQRFECYFKDHPSEKSWMWESRMEESNPFGGMDVGVHSRYTVKGFQGPSMMEKASAYMAAAVNPGSFKGELEEEAIRQLLFKIETRQAARDKANEDVPEQRSKPKAPISPPSEHFPSVPAPGPVCVPKPIIGKLPPNYVPPQERTVGVPPKDNSRNFHYRTPIKTEAAVGRVVQAGLSSLVSIRQEDLLAIAPEYRKKMGTEEVLEVFMNEQKELTEGERIYVGQESTSIRGVMAVVGERPVHCITDWGCSIIAMSVAACNALGLMFDPTRCIPLQSANGKTDWMLGIARDIPFRFGDVTAILQVHIVNSPAYDVLLGRPFEVLTQARTQSFLSGDQHITITDPNTEKIVTIPTVPREPPKFQKLDEREWRAPKTTWGWYICLKKIHRPRKPSSMGREIEMMLFSPLNESRKA